MNGKRARIIHKAIRADQAPRVLSDRRGAGGGNGLRQPAVPLSLGKEGSEPVSGFKKTALACPGTRESGACNGKVAYGLD